MRHFAVALIAVALGATGAVAAAQTQAPDEIASPPHVQAAQSASATPTPLQAAPAPAATPAPRPLPANAAAAGPYPGPVEPPPGGWVSRAAGRPNGGHLVGGVLLPATGPDHLSWDPILHRVPNREWRRAGTDRLVVTILRVAAAFRAAHPDAAPLLVADLSRPRGGVFDQRFGGLGHASHQNGLDVDIQYPRKDRRPLPPSRPADVDFALAQELVDRFVAAGAQYVFVGPRVRLRGPSGVVQPLRHHDDHLHVRLRP